MEARTSVEWVLFTEDYRPHWPVNWRDVYGPEVPEECAWLSNRPATEREAKFALTLSKKGKSGPPR